MFNKNKKMLKNLLSFLLYLNVIMLICPVPTCNCGWTILFTLLGLSVLFSGWYFWFFLFGPGKDYHLQINFKRKGKTNHYSKGLNNSEENTQKSTKSNISLAPNYPSPSTPTTTFTKASSTPSPLSIPGTKLKPHLKRKKEKDFANMPKVSGADPLWLIVMCYHHCHYYYCHRRKLPEVEHVEVHLKTSLVLVYAIFECMYLCAENKTFQTKWSSKHSLQAS